MPSLGLERLSLRGAAPEKLGATRIDPGSAERSKKKCDVDSTLDSTSIDIEFH